MPSRPARIIGDAWHSGVTFVSEIAETDSSSKMGQEQDQVQEQGQGQDRVKELVQDPVQGQDRVKELVQDPVQGQDLGKASDQVQEDLKSPLAQS